MKKVIINADDFGYSSAVNAGIIKAFQEGVLTSATLMANMPSCDEAIELAKKNPGLGVGGHLTLTCGSAMTSGPSIHHVNGTFYTLSEYQKQRHLMNEADIFSEWCYQIDYLLDKGMALTHLDSHHHLHTFQENLEITQQISQKYQLTFRNAFGLEAQIHLPYQKGIKGFLDLMNYPDIRDLTQSVGNNKEACFEEIQAVLAAVVEEVTELMVHPAFVDEALYFNSSFSIARMKEVAILCDPKMKELLRENNLELFHYGNLSSSSGIVKNKE